MRVKLPHRPRKPQRRARAFAVLAPLVALLLQAMPPAAHAEQAGFVRPEWAVDADDLEPDLSAVEDEAGLVASLPSPSEVSSTQGGAAFMPFDLSGGAGSDPDASSRDEVSLFESAVMLLAAMAAIGWILRLWWRTH